MAAVIIGAEVMDATWRVASRVGMRRAAKYAERWFYAEAGREFDRVAERRTADTRVGDRLTRAAVRCGRIVAGLPAFGGAK